MKHLSATGLCGLFILFCTMYNKLIKKTFVVLFVGFPSHYHGNANFVISIKGLQGDSTESLSLKFTLHFSHS